MKRHSALVPLSHDHQHGLAAALRLKRAAESAHEDWPERIPALRAECAMFVRFSQRELAAHFEDEERMLLPLLVSTDPSMSAESERMVLEHAHLGDAIATLQRSSDENLPAIAAQVASLLHDHIRWEERELFEALQQRFTSEQLDAMGLMPRGVAR